MNYAIFTEMGAIIKRLDKLNNRIEKQKTAEDLPAINAVMLSRLTLSEAYMTAHFQWFIPWAGSEEGRAEHAEIIARRVDARMLRNCPKRQKRRMKKLIAEDRAKRAAKKGAPT